ncbi:hypothetical protein B0H10DRAFT_1970739 [Mycena sp. CBHHK59/15]|nr:hypothetical protein B0H10DRAFT_1970739 [Mycena sp. CBHHK59/15]
MGFSKERRKGEAARFWCWGLGKMECGPTFQDQIDRHRIDARVGPFESYNMPKTVARGHPLGPLGGGGKWYGIPMRGQNRDWDYFMDDLNDTSESEEELVVKTDSSVEEEVTVETEESSVFVETDVE